MKNLFMLLVLIWHTEIFVQWLPMGGKEDNLTAPAYEQAVKFLNKKQNAGIVHDWQIMPYWAGKGVNDACLLVWSEEISPGAVATRVPGYKQSN